MPFDELVEKSTNLNDFGGPFFIFFDFFFGVFDFIFFSFFSFLTSIVWTYCIVWSSPSDSVKSIKALTLVLDACKYNDAAKLLPYVE